MNFNQRQNQEIGAMSYIGYYYYNQGHREKGCKKENIWHTKQTKKISNAQCRYRR